MEVRADKWFEGSYWTATLPDDWTFRKDTTVRGFPYVLESAPATRLQIGETRDVRLSENMKWTRKDIGSEEHRKAYALTLMEASGSRSRTVGGLVKEGARRTIGLLPEVAKHSLGPLVGFTYELEEGDRVGWAGYFSAEPWMLYAKLLAPADVIEAKSAQAFEVLRSVKFRRESDGFDS